MTWYEPGLCASNQKQAFSLLLLNETPEMDNASLHAMKDQSDAENPTRGTPSRHRIFSFFIPSSSLHK